MSSAMLTFRRLVEILAPDNALVHKDGKWNLWYMGEDWGMNEAQKAAFIASEDSYELSCDFGEVVAEKDGAIRALNLGDKYDSLSILRQLSVFLDTTHIVSYCGLTIDLEFKIEGDRIAVDVVTIEREYLETQNDEYALGEPTRRIAVRFLYDPQRQVLLHSS
jgi:hypothetical protein